MSFSWRYIAACAVSGFIAGMTTDGIGTGLLVALAFNVLLRLIWNQA